MNHSTLKHPSGANCGGLLAPRLPFVSQSGPLTIGLRRLLASLVIILAGLALSPLASGQDDVDSPRGAKKIYQPPKLIPISTGKARQQAAATRLNPPESSDYSNSTGNDDLVPAVVVTSFQDEVEEIAAEPVPAPMPESDGGLTPPTNRSGGSIMVDEGTIYHDAFPMVDHHVYGNLPACDAAPGDFLSCDGCCDSAGGCDAIGACGCSNCRVGPLAFGPWFNQNWFGSAEWMYWVRRGQDFPVLAVSGTNPLFGGQGRMGEDGESGARFTVGTWLDNSKCRSIVGRFWAAGQEEHGFFANQNSGFNVSVPSPLGDFAIIDATPAGENEFLNIGFESEVFGGDVSLRQLWLGGMGARVDFLYGYQYFRLNESLELRSQSVSPNPPPGSEALITDNFDVSNEFHAGQFGLATSYKERRWSFEGLFKIGLGNLKRTADLSFRGTQTQRPVPPGIPAPVTAGTLVAAGNAGTGSTDSFAVMPEVRLSLGYRVNRYTDLTMGYTYLSVSDVLQVANTVNTVDYNRNFTHHDYWMHGVHLGVNFNY